MSTGLAVALGMGFILIVSIVNGLRKKTWPSDRQLAGLFVAGLVLMLIGHASRPLAIGLTVLMDLAVVLSAGGIIPNIAVLAPPKQRVPTVIASASPSTGVLAP